MSTTNARSWRVALATRIGIGVYAVFMYAFAALIIGLPFAHAAGDRPGDWFVITGGVVMACFGLVASFAFVAVVRTRVTLDGRALAATVVDRHNGFLVPHFRSVDVPVREIASVERRSEVYHTLGLRSMRDALSIVTTGGERIGLFSNSLGSADILPLDDVAEAIAAAAGVPVKDDGTVLARGSGLYGAAASSWTERSLDPARASSARRSVMLTIQITTGLLVLSVLLRALL